VHAMPLTGRRLSALDGSFVRLDSPRSPMHVGWSAVFAAPPRGERPTIEALRSRVAGRLDQVSWCRWRLQPAPLGLTEPRWIEDDGFDLACHVLAACGPDDVVSPGAFAALRDALLSQPLDPARPPWQIWLVARLEDGRVGMVGKVHHALVDGIAALQIAGLVSDEPLGGRVAPAVQIGTDGSTIGWVRETLERTIADGLAVGRAVGAAGTRPSSTARGALRAADRVLRAAQEDLLPRAPRSSVNASIGARRSLVGYHARRPDVRAARRAGGTINDIGLAVVAGALRTAAMREGAPPQAPLKAMVPVSMRGVGEFGPGNRIAMVNLRLPVDLPTPRERLAFVRAQTHELKTGDRAEATEALYKAGAILPAPLRGPVVKAMASPRTFNLTVSQSPAPRTLSVLGCPMEELYSVVPISEGHALAIGMVRFDQELFFGCYADPDALPTVAELPALLHSELLALGDLGREREHPSTRTSDRVSAVGS
jgi:diacylglycerol O-acyltransferase